MTDILLTRFIDSTYNQDPNQLPDNTYIFTVESLSRFNSIHVKTTTGGMTSNLIHHESYELYKSTLLKKGLYITSDPAGIASEIAPLISSVIHITNDSLIIYEVYKMSLIKRHETPPIGFSGDINEIIELVCRLSLHYCIRTCGATTYDRSLILGDVNRSYKNTKLTIGKVDDLGEISGSDNIKDIQFEIARTITLPQSKFTKGLYFIKHKSNPKRMDIYYRDSTTLIKILGYNDLLIPFMIGDVLRQHNKIAYAPSRNQLLGYRGDVNPLGMYPKDSKYVIAKYDKDLKQYIDVVSFQTSSFPTFNTIVGLNSNNSQIDEMVNKTHSHVNESLLMHLKDMDGWLTYKGNRLLRTLPAPW